MLPSDLSAMRDDDLLLLYLDRESLRANECDALLAEFRRRGLRESDALLVMQLAEFEERLRRLAAAGRYSAGRAASSTGPTAKKRAVSAA
jgi:hypothetical protein